MCVPGRFIDPCTDENAHDVHGRRTHKSENHLASIHRRTDTQNVVPLCTGLFFSHGKG